MPLYDYQCAACGRRYEVVHGVHAEGPTTCPLCGKGPVRKAITAAAIHYKGTGWAKKERRATAASGAARASGEDGSSSDGPRGDETSTSDASKGGTSKGETSKGETSKEGSAKESHPSEGPAKDESLRGGRSKDSGRGSHDKDPGSAAPARSRTPGSGTASTTD
jgi:putative FmdB family regulatory protein